MDVSRDDMVVLLERKPHAGAKVDTPDLVLIKAHAVRIHYWRGRDAEELVLLPLAGATLQNASTHHAGPHHVGCAPS